MKNDSIRWTIALGFGLLLGLMSMLAWYAHITIDNSTQRLVELVEVTNQKAADAHTMRNIIRTRGNILSAMHLTDDVFEREELRLQLHGYSREYKLARDSLIDRLSHARERFIMSRLFPAASIAREKNDAAANLLVSDAPHAAIKASVIEANAARESMLSILDELVLWQERHAEYALADSKRYQQNTNTIIMYLSFIALCTGLLIAFQVIRHTSSKNRAMQFQASHDSLTRLVNRIEFKRRLSSTVSHNTGQQHALCYLDLDQFKIINDTCGHEAGDELLVQITRLIQSKVRTRDVLARLGGDEFGLLLENCSLDKALEVCEGIVTVVRKHDFQWKGRSYHVGVSIGLIPITSKDSNVEQLMSEADLACYAAKDMGRNRVHLHNTEGTTVRKMQQELDWVADISSTIEQNRFELHAQPIVPCAGSDDIAMYEVLLRLRNNQNRIISPGNYIPAAERFNLMREVDIWVAESAIRFLADAVGHPENRVRLFINLSANSVTDTHFIEHIHGLLQQYSIPRGALCFEITETSAIKNIDQAVEIMHQLKNCGCMFALDDFGKGMSSFGYLKNLPVDYLKLDGDLVKNIDNSDIDLAMVSAISEIGRVMNIETIAEHVESPAIHRLVSEIGIDYAQGFHICKPSSLQSINTHWPAHNVYHIGS